MLWLTIVQRKLLEFIAVYMCANSFRQQWHKHVVEKKKMEALNLQNCFRITTLESTRYEHFPVWPHFPSLRAWHQRAGAGSEVTASTTLPLSVFTSPNPPTALWLKHPGKRRTAGKRDIWNELRRLLLATAANRREAECGVLRQAPLLTPETEVSWTWLRWWEAC